MRNLDYIRKGVDTDWLLQQKKRLLGAEKEHLPKRKAEHHPKQNSNNAGNGIAMLLELFFASWA